MDFEEGYCRSYSTPKLALSKLPAGKARQPVQMVTPPFHPSVSIPFRWEEAPGKPRFLVMEDAVDPPSKSKAVRCLDLPPSKITIVPSEMDGSNVGRSLSLACTFSFRKGSEASREDWLEAAPRKRNFGSGRWGSGEVIYSSGRGSFEFTHSMDEKVAGVRRRRSFFNLSTVNYNNLVGICSSIKRAVVPRRRQRRHLTVGSAETFRLKY